MPSARQIAANRRNSSKSTGPRSASGRRTSARNALRHGLAIDIATDASKHDEIESLTKALSNRLDKISEYAREAAKAEFDLLRIRKIRRSSRHFISQRKLLQLDTPN